MSVPHPLRILVVDDDPDTAGALALLLRLWGHEVLVARDGAEALAEAAARPPDVALIDIAMPGLDGHEVARRLREDIRTRQALLCALSGLAQEEDRRRSLEAGCDLHLVKPVEPAELKALLAAARKLAPRYAGGPDPPPPGSEGPGGAVEAEPDRAGGVGPDVRTPAPPGRLLPGIPRAGSPPGPPRPPTGPPERAP